MKEYPILFQGDMVRALLAGTKTQTRRAVKPQTVYVHEAFCDGDWLMNTANGFPVKSPYGYRGDRLWVRETLKPWTADPALFAYAADDTRVEGDGMNYPVIGRKYVPSIHLERCWSRILLDVAGVRVERVQAISAGDCWAEGIPSSPDVDPVHQYHDLWDSINGGRPGLAWKDNPWVWVVDFTRSTP